MKRVSPQRRERLRGELLGAVRGESPLLSIPLETLTSIARRYADAFPSAKRARIAIALDSLANPEREVSEYHYRDPAYELARELIAGIATRNGQTLYPEYHSREDCADGVNVPLRPTQWVGERVSAARRRMRKVLCKLDNAHVAQLNHNRSDTEKTLGLYYRLKGRSTKTGRGTLTYHIPNVVAQFVLARTARYSFGLQAGTCEDVTAIAELVREMQARALRKRESVRRSIIRNYPRDTMRPAHGNQPAIMIHHTREGQRHKLRYVSFTHGAYYVHARVKRRKYGARECYVDSIQISRTLLAPDTGRFKSVLYARGAK